MKTTITFVAAIMMTIATLSANTNPTTDGPVANTQVAEPAKFLGNNDLIQPWLAGEVVYPTLAQENSREGEVIITFTIDENGRPGDFVIEQGIGLGCEEAVIAAIQRMPRWKPARNAAGIQVAVTHTVVVDFAMF